MGDTLGVVNCFLRRTIVPDLDTDRSGSCSMFGQDYNLAATPSLRDYGLVDRLPS